MIQFQCFCLMILSSLLVPLYSHWAKKRQVVDIPNARSSHAGVTPRGGGLVFVGLWMGWLLTQYGDLPHWVIASLCPPVLLLMCLGFWDDLCDLSAVGRLIGQIVAAGFFLGVLTALSDHPITLFGLPVWIEMPMALLALVWSTNLFNFMDGTDGIASLEALWVFIPGSFLLSHYHAWPLLWVTSGLSACIFGFLIWNWPKATIFMGDVGSSVLGFVIVAIALSAEHFYGCPIWYWLVLYGVFWFDATVTLCRRALCKQPIWQAHRLHAYQRLHQSGVSHLNVLKWLSGINALLTVLVLLTLQFAWLSFANMIALTLCILTLYYRKIEHLKPFSKIT